MHSPKVAQIHLRWSWLKRLKISYSSKIRDCERCAWIRSSFIYTILTQKLLQELSAFDADFFDEIENLKSRHREALEKLRFFEGRHWAWPFWFGAHGGHFVELYIFNCVNSCKFVLECRERLSFHRQFCEPSRRYECIFEPLSEDKKPWYGLANMGLNIELASEELGKIPQNWYHRCPNILALHNDITGIHK